MLCGAFRLRSIRRPVLRVYTGNYEFRFDKTQSGVVNFKIVFSRRDLDAVVEADCFTVNFRRFQTHGRRIRIRFEFVRIDDGDAALRRKPEFAVARFYSGWLLPAVAFGFEKPVGSAERD
jgi:hypothetical protein